MSLKRLIRKWLELDAIEDDLDAHAEALKSVVDCLEQVTTDVAAMHVVLHMRRIGGLMTPLTEDERKRAH